MLFLGARVFWWLGRCYPALKRLPSPRGGYLAPQGQLLSLGRRFRFKCLQGSGFLWHGMQNSVLGLLDETLGA